jgi:uncharacterized protein YPO0396
VDAVTTLLMPANRIAYNRAAGADTRERNLRSYVLGHYKSERNELSGSAKPVALRTHNSYSVILGVFYNEGFDQAVALAQVFWIRESQGQPDRFYVIADRDMSISQDFAHFGTEIVQLRKRLRASKVEIEDSFPPYGAAFRRRLGIASDQALELFHQTVSMKSVGNLTDFVRQHMLEPFEVVPRIQALIVHFDDLNRAHEAVLKAKRQVELLTPLVADCQRHEELLAEAEQLKACRNALSAYFAELKVELLEKRLEGLEQELRRLDVRIASLLETQTGQKASESHLRQAIGQNGGDRIERLAEEIVQKDAERQRRFEKYQRYRELAETLNLKAAQDAQKFVDQWRNWEELREASASQEALVQNKMIEVQVHFAQVRAAHESVSAEIASLKARRSNIDSRQITVRTALCDALGLDDTELPFAGELIQVRENERDWEGAAERLLRGFGLSLLVPEEHYAQVASWVDRTHLRGRLVYYRVRELRSQGREAVPPLHPKSLVRKLSIKPDSPFYQWVERQVAQRFDHACCSTQEEFRRETRAITRNGQIKSPGERHDKDDRFDISDRGNYVLGWSNAEKITALEARQWQLASDVADIASKLSTLGKEQGGLRDTLSVLSKLEEYRDFRELNWEPLAADVARLEDEKRKLEAASDVLQELTRQLEALTKEAAATTEELDKRKDDRATATYRRKQAGDLLTDTLAFLTPEAVASLGIHRERLEVLRAEMPAHQLSVESCANRESDLRGELQRRIDAEVKKHERLRDKIIEAMKGYKDAYKLDTQDVDVSIGAAPEYRQLLEQLTENDLPRFLSRFKELLNENTIRDIANFQSQLARERETIKERIAKINESLTQIDYNPGRYIVLEAQAATDAEIRDFQVELRACTEGAMTGSDDSQYSESKFLQVRAIIERFRGREGTAELDRRWTGKVTDVRNWFVFAASERWREDGSEHEHYSDSGGKSGGQKEKLAYTILAASLAYQFGLEWGETRSRSFRFVMIDEAFGRGSDESAQYGLRLFQQLNLQLLIVTPLQKIHIIEPFVSSVGFVHNEEGRASRLRNLSIEEYQAEKAARRT